MSEQRLIDANKIPFIEYINGSVNVEKEVIDRQPTIDPETLPIVQELKKEIEELKGKLKECEPVIHAHWIHLLEENTCQCSYCSHKQLYDNYCSHCGAKMDEEVK